MRARIQAVACAAAVAGGCFGRSDGGAAHAAGAAPPLTRGDWTFYGGAQGLSEDVQDVSADEAGNVYVAGGDALYAKGPADQAFGRFDAANAGLTRSCNEQDAYFTETPSKPFHQCRVQAVAGGPPGTVYVGYDSWNIEPQTGAAWTYRAGGLDVVAFDAAKPAASRTRHAWIASPPHTICTKPVYGRTSTCDPTDYWWSAGRRVVVSIRRIVVNHDRSSPMYGDVWMGGQHGTLSALLASAAARGLPDRTAGQAPEWADAKDVWEHEHPSYVTTDGTFVNGLGWGVAIDPTTGIPWGSNEYRTEWLGGYGADLSNDAFYGGGHLDVWKDPLPDTPDATMDDHVRSLSFCADGTLWIGSATHGLARRDPGGGLSYPALPDPSMGVSALACDPLDASLWIGLASGGLLRLRNGTFEAVDTTGWPAFARNPVQSIQIDRWSQTRALWFAFAPVADASGAVLTGGGVASFNGP